MMLEQYGIAWHMSMYHYMQQVKTIMMQLTLFWGYLVTTMCKNLPSRVSHDNPRDQPNLVLQYHSVNMITRSLIFTRDHHVTPPTKSGIHDTTVILS